MRITWYELPRERICGASVDIGFEACFSSRRVWQSVSDVNLVQSDNLTLDCIVPLSEVAWYRADKEDETKSAEPGLRCTTS